MPYAKSSRPPLSELQIADKLMEDTSSHHPAVVLTDRGQVFNAALHIASTHAAIVTPEARAKETLQGTLVDIWDRARTSDPLHLVFYFASGGEIAMRRPACELKETEAKALGGYAHLLSMGFGVADVLLEISPRPTIDFNRLKRVPVVATSFFQSAFAWYDTKDQPHLVLPGSTIGSRQGAIRLSAEVDADRPVLSLMARPAV